MSEKHFVCSCLPPWTKSTWQRIMWTTKRKNVQSEKSSLKCEAAKWHPKKQMLHLNDGSVDSVHRDRSALKIANKSQAYQAPKCRCCEMANDCFAECASINLQSGWSNCQLSRQWCHLSICASCSMIFACCVADCCPFFLWEPQHMTS